MLKIYHIISGDLWAGAEVVAYSLLKKLQNYPEFDISVILLNEGRLAAELRKSGVTIHIITEKNLSFVDILLKIKKIFKNQPPDIIHSHRYKENITSFIMSCVFKKARLIATQHGMPESYFSDMKISSRLINNMNLFLLKKKFDVVVSVSYEIKQNLINNFGFNNNRINVIHNGINIPQLSERNKNDTFTIGSAGRLVPIKDFSLFIEIAKYLHQKDTDINFLIAGDGPERTKLQTLVDKYNLTDHFKFLGHIDNMDSFYNDLNLYLNTSIHEGIPMTILESMAHFVPVIAPDVGGFKEVVTNGKDGFLIGHRDPAVFANKCLQLYENRKMLNKMAEAAKIRIAQNFSSEHMAEKYRSLYVNLS